MCVVFTVSLTGAIPTDAHGVRKCGGGGCGGCDTNDDANECASECGACGVDILGIVGATSDDIVSSRLDIVATAGISRIRPLLCE